MKDNIFKYDHNYSIRENMISMFENQSRTYRNIAIFALAHNIVDDNDNIMYLFNQHFYSALNNNGINNLAKAIVLRAKK